jgi:hypothetical protein
LLSAAISDPLGYAVVNDSVKSACLECPLWVIGGRGGNTEQCPLWPPKADIAVALSKAR